MKLYYGPTTCALAPSIGPLGYVPLLEPSPGTFQAPERPLAPANGTVERYQRPSRLDDIATEAAAIRAKAAA